ncbi:MAG: hypothetical protein IMW96_10645 [Thermoanaerobacteraceae bacterium]|nr:hypothetical protein [Thermoanaerobacteraceae bacterium]
MPRYGYKEYQSYREFLNDQRLWMFLLWLFFIPLLFLALPWPEAAQELGEKPLLSLIATPADWRLFLLFAFLHLLGAAILAALLALFVVAVACAAIWLTLVVREIAEIPGTEAKICRLTWKERLGRYIDFRGFD